MQRQTGALLLVAVLTAAALAVLGYFLSQINQGLDQLDGAVETLSQRLDQAEARSKVAERDANVAQALAEEAERHASTARDEAVEAGKRADQAQEDKAVAENERQAALEAKREAEERSRAAAEREEQALAEATKAYEAATAARQEAEQARAETAKVRQRRESEINRLQSALGELAETRRTALGLVMNLGKGVEFDFDKADLRPENRELLSRIAGVLMTAGDYHIQVFGHTDDVGTEEYNQELSERRAQSVVDYLVASGIKPNIISAKGLGKTQPLVEGTDEESRQRNRRVEIAVVSYNESYLPIDTEASAAASADSPP